MKKGDKVRVKATGVICEIQDIYNTGLFKDERELRLTHNFDTLVNSKTGGFHFSFDDVEPLNEPTDPYADLDLSEELPSSEVVNESEGVTCCPLLKLLDDTKDQVQGDQPEPTFEAKMLAYYDDSFSAMIVEPPHHLA